MLHQGITIKSNHMMILTIPSTKSETSYIDSDLFPSNWDQSQHGLCLKDVMASFTGQAGALSEDSACHKI